MFVLLVFFVALINFILNRSKVFYFVALIIFSRNLSNVFYLVALINFSENRLNVFFYRPPSLDYGFVLI